ncbi:MAG TPA: S8 family serine peptidase [Gaiellaceae bacterium]|nr:S8 family serine peptidase [Gaiellaceae bacterium]
MKSRLARTLLAGGVVGLIAFAVAAASAGVGNAGTSLDTFGWSSHLTAAQANVLSPNADQRVIVLLRNQQTALAGRGAEAQRAQAFRADRRPIVAQLQQLHVPRLVTYKTVNAVATTVSSAEAANLRRDPAVLAVDPDAVVKGPSTNANLLPATTRARVPHAAIGSAKAAATSYATCGTASAPLLEPEALHLINVDNRTNADAPMTSGPKSAHSLGYTGAGVSIAVFPDGMDPNIPDFTRGGTSAVTDYQDFSGEGTNAVTGGEEAFGDVSSIVSQAQTTYNLDQEINPDFATNGGTCDVKVLGVAPGANVDVMKVFGDTNAGLTSTILQGIDYAIQQDHVNILSISLGFFANPTSAAQQPLTAILKNAIADGTTVVAGTGDSSPSNTESSPALQAGVIGAAASTSYRLNAQTNWALYDLAQTVHKGSGTPSYQLGQTTPGWLSNEVSTLSSSGVTEDRRAPDVIAPGDGNWSSCSTDVATYTECANGFGGSNIGIEDFGGTSESAPLTAGVAALVIQAYRESHSNQTPTPAVVRRIIFSSATDIGIAAEEQGSGLLNGLRAVQLAKSYGTHTSDGGLLHSPDAISALGKPGQSFRQTVTVTNSGSSKATIKPMLRTLGPAKTLANGKLNLFRAGRGTQGSCAGNKTVEYYTGETIPELSCKTFTVPKGVDELDSRIGWQPLQSCSGCTAGEPTVREILIDPKGRFGQYSDPQGDGAGFADEQIHQPTPGKWTLLIFGRTTSNYEGAVSYQETAQKFKTVKHAVKPVSKAVGPGKSVSFSVKVPTPATPGFWTGAVVFHSNRQQSLGTIPVVSEAKVPVTAKKAGKFTGTLIGGNGRFGFFAQQLSYQFTVPKGVKDLDVNMTASHEGYLLLGQLVDPHGMAVDQQMSFTQVNSFGDSDNVKAVQLVWANPASGTWKVDVANGLPFLPGLDVYSGLTHATLHGVVSFNTSKVSASGMPSGTLTPGKTVTAHVKVKNTGAEPETYQLDPRTNTQTQYAAQSAGNTDGTLPVQLTDSVPQYLVSPFSSQLKVTTSTTGSTPIEFDVSSFWGAPDIASPPSTGGTTSVTVSNPFASEWATAPTEIGPYGSPATSEDYSTSATVTTLGFDQNADPDTGDVWADVVGGANEGVNPLFLKPGQSGTMNITFTVPAGTAGTTISGEVPVETFGVNSFTTGFGDWSSDVLSVLHYSYTLG